MEVGMGKCDKCTMEEILKHYPDYKGERWGNMPIWGAIRSIMPEVLCVIGDDDWITQVCLEHLGLQLKDSK